MTDYADQNAITRLWGAIKKFLTYSNGTKATPVDADYLLLSDSADTESVNGTTIPKIKRILFSDLRKAVGGVLDNRSTASQTGFASDTYLAGSVITFPTAPAVGTRYRLQFDVTKTGAGTAAINLIIRLGTAGSTADTARLTFTFGTATAAADSGIIDVDLVFRSIGSGTSAVLVGTAIIINNLASTGLTNVTKAKVVVSSGFDSTVSGLKIGASYNGGTSAAHTIQLVKSELVM